MAITTTAEYKTYAVISGTTLDTLLGVLIPIAQRAAEEWCGRPAAGFESATWTQFLDGRGSDVLWFPCWPVDSITSLSYRDATGGLTALDTTSYRIGDRGRVTRTGVVYASVSEDQEWPDAEAVQFHAVPQYREGFGNFKAVYVGGYSSGSMPSTLKYAVWRITDGLYAARRRDGAIASESIGAYSITYRDRASMITGEIQALLSEWRRQA